MSTARWLGAVAVTVWLCACAEDVTLGEHTPDPAPGEMAGAQSQPVAPAGMVGQGEDGVASEQGERTDSTQVPSGPEDVDAEEHATDDSEDSEEVEDPEVELEDDDPEIALEDEPEDVEAPGVEEDVDEADEVDDPDSTEPFVEAEGALEGDAADPEEVEDEPVADDSGLDAGSP